MAGQPNISAILAALAQRPEAVPGQMPQQNQQQSPSSFHHLPAQGYPQQPPHAPVVHSMPSYPPPQPLPQPTSTGRIDVSNIKPVSSGSVSLSNPAGPERGGLYNGMRDAWPPRDADPHMAGSSYRPRRSRSRSPDRYRQDNNRDNFNPYREERRDIHHQLAPSYNVGSPAMRGPPPASRFSPSGARMVGGPPERSSLPQGGSQGGFDDNSEIISIGSGLVGLIIGRQGENLRRIEKDTQTRVQFVTPPDAGGLERECKITGLPGQREYAKSEIYRVIQESGKDPGSSSGRAPPPPDRDMGIGMKQAGAHQPALRTGEDSVTMMVPNRTVGLIIGKGGETIRDLQERSHCHVNITGEDKSEGGLRPVNLIGTPEAAKMARDLIMDIVETDTKNLPNSGGKPDNGMFRGGGNEKINDQIIVPSESVGMIIGKGGETIKEMQISTGCKINVSPASGRDIERHIGLIGSRDAIERAKDAITDKVRAVQQKSRASGDGQFGDRVNDQRPQSQQQQQYNNQVGQPATGEADPYAAYGGYQNYVALWYSSLQANQAPQDQNTQGSHGS